MIDMNISRGKFDIFKKHLKFKVTERNQNIRCSIKLKIGKLKFRMKEFSFQTNNFRIVVMIV